MNRISGSTAYFKVVFPIIWFGFLAFFILGGIRAETFDLMFVLAPLAMALFGAFIMKKLVWDLADEVYDCGSYLLFRTSGIEQKVLLSEVVNLSHSQFSSPKRITLHLRAPGTLGSELTFNPPMRLNPFSKSDLVSSLIHRIDKARRAADA